MAPDGSGSSGRHHSERVGSARPPARGGDRGAASPRSRKLRSRLLPLLSFPLPFPDRCVIGWRRRAPATARQRCGHRRTGRRGPPDWHVDDRDGAHPSLLCQQSDRIVGLAASRRRPRSRAGRKCGRGRLTRAWGRLPGPPARSLPAGTNVGARRHGNRFLSTPRSPGSMARSRATRRSSSRTPCKHLFFRLTFSRNRRTLATFSQFKDTFS